MLFACLGFSLSRVRAGAQQTPPNLCFRPQPGSTVLEPEDLASRNGVLKVDLTVRDYIESDGSVRYCYTDANGHESPTLRLSPGDLLILNLKNDLTEPAQGVLPISKHQMPPSDDANCTSGLMTPTSTNLHFHGLTIPRA